MKQSELNDILDAIKHRDPKETTIPNLLVASTINEVMADRRMFIGLLDMADKMLSDLDAVTTLAMRSAARGDVGYLKSYKENNLASLSKALTRIREVLAKRERD